MTILEMLRRGKDFTAAEVSLAEYILANAQLVPGASATPA